jgi:hypothetical protein
MKYSLPGDIAKFEGSVDWFVEREFTYPARKKDLEKAMVIALIECAKLTEENAKLKNQLAKEVE